MIETKICKGYGKTKDFDACGEPVKAITRKFGLCQKCYSKWIISDDPNAKETFSKLLLNNKKSFEKKQKIKANKEKEEMNINLISTDKYRAKYVQPIINNIARIIDYGCPCIATENYGKMNGGHYIGVGANRTIALNLHNIHIQAFESNHWKSGDNLRYRFGLERIYGIEYLNFIESLNQCKPLKLNKKDLSEIKENATKILKELEEKFRSPNERIELRNQVNIRLNIYPKEYSIF